MAANPSPLTAPTAEDVRAWHRVQAAAFAHDRPGEPVPSEEELRTRLTARDGGRQMLWLVRGGGQDPVATGALRLPGAAGPDQPAAVDMTVHPAHRRMGAGSRLLATVTEAAAGAGCGSLAAEVVAGTSGESFLATRDFQPVLRLSRLRLALDEISEQVAALPDVPHPGYRLTWWEGAVPDSLAAGCARAARSLADDLPAGRSLLARPLLGGPPRDGMRLLTVAAIAEADGAVAGCTELALDGAGAGIALEYGSAVLAAHRGHGLGRWMKARMLRLARAADPGTLAVATDSADDDRHMLAVNTALGFRPTRRAVIYRLKLRVR